MKSTISSRTFPDAWKKAKLKPPFKKSESKELPQISLLPLTFKVLHIPARTTELLDKRKILLKFQSWFRKNPFNQCSLVLFY